MKQQKIKEIPTVYCNVGTIQYKSKPQKNNREMGIVQKDTNKPSNIRLDELADKIAQGISFRCAAVNGQSGEDWQSQRLFGIDIDNKGDYILTLEEAFKIAEGYHLPPCIVYYSFSHSEKLPKFRLIFCLSHTITDGTQRDAIQNYIFNCFNVAELVADKQCLNKGRFFFGTNKGIVYSDYMAQIDTIKLLAQINKGEQVKDRKKANNKPKTTSRSTGTENIQAIIQHDAEKLKQIIGAEHKVFETTEAMFNYIYQDIDLSELLQVPYKKAFHCILPNHPDSTPSASVFKSNSGVWFYHCFAEGKVLNIKQIIELLGGYKSAYKAVEFIKTIYNIELVKNSWQKEQEENLNDITRYLNGANENNFADFCPTAAKNTRNYMELYRIIIGIARDNIYPNSKTADGQIIFSMSVRQVAKALGIKENNVKRVHNQINMLAYHGMIVKLADDEVPKTLVKTVLRHKDEKHKSHIQFYSIPSWIVEQLEYIEGQGQKWKANNYTMRGISYEMFYRGEGEEVAARLYPQNCKHKNKQGQIVAKTTSKQADNLHDIIRGVIYEMINTNGYAKENDVIEVLRTEYSKGRTETQIKKSLKEILDCDNLTKVRANKELKARFGLDDNPYSHPTLIIPSE